ncbi:MAG: hypothetical protein KDJ80_11535 [Nitratireductor sp.]|nr:hypothetical protein [Nitratireductor sp.]
MKLTYRLTADSLSRALRRLQAMKPVPREGAVRPVATARASSPTNRRPSRHERRP